MVPKGLLVHSRLLVPKRAIGPQVGYWPIKSGLFVDKHSSGRAIGPQVGYWPIKSGLFVDKHSSGTQKYILAR